MDALAKETGFIQRKRKLTARLFLEMLLCKSFSPNQQSLLDHQRELSIHAGVEITKQSLDQRFTPQATAFIKVLLSEQMDEVIDYSIPMLASFSHVFIQDSTRFK
ncbi:MAG: hypothetical protein AAFQ98_16675, partial [Bacteroidota bacterium]